MGRGHVGQPKGVLRSAGNTWVKIKGLLTQTKSIFFSFLNVTGEEHRILRKRKGKIKIFFGLLKI